MAHAPIRISGDMTIYRAGEIKDLIFDAMAREQNIEANLDEVTRIDCAGVQLLAVAHAEAERRDKSFRVVGVSQAVSDMIGLLNLEHLIDGPLIMDPVQGASHG